MIEIGHNALCLGVVIVIGVVAGIAAWRGNWPD